ncbi:MAG: polysaccharide deacetylase family protein [Epsilonproteobacteria bacterium]|nr:polysaccharide deacetylase family protein [Campylobacterota bacterium]
MTHQKHRQQNNAYFHKKSGVLFALFFLPLFLFADAHIFVYHRFGDKRYTSTSTPISQLKNEFEYLKKNGYKVVKLSTLVQALKNKEKISDKWVVLTIDDSYRSFYENGLEVFKKYGYPFTIFVYVKSVENKYPDYTSWKELKTISKYGEIAYHSYSHPHMTYKSDDFLKKDFAKGLRIFEKRMGFKPKYFAYPYGEFDNRVKNIAKSFGFQAILNQNIGAIDKNSDLFDLDRIALTGNANLKVDLAYKHLNAVWIKPKNYPTNGILKQIVAKLDSNDTKDIDYYLSNYGWHKAKIKNGYVSVDIDKKLSKGRNRIALKIKNKIAIKLLIKDKYERK